jgi:HEAT repeat protein
LYTYAKQTYQLELPHGFFERALEAGRCLVLFDGLDEVTASDQRVEVRDAVAAFATRYSKNRFVVTSRIIGYESAPLDRNTFAHHTIMPFNESEIATFIEKWYTARERDASQANAQAEHLIRTIQQNDRLKKLAENPLMLTIIALVHRIEAELPNERVRLYDKCTEALLSTWEGIKGIPYDRERPHYKQRRRLLERLAFWMHTLEQAEGRQAEVKRGDLELKLTDLLCEDEKLGLGRDAARAEAQAFIELAKSRTGILVERGDGIFSFVHLTFQEYFAACDLEARYVHNLDALWQQIQPHLYEARWREVILLLLGRLNRYDEPPNVIFEKILRERNRFDDVIHRNLFLAAQCLADGISIRERLRNDVVDALLKFARAEPPKYVSLRYDAIVALGTLRGNVRAGEGLLALAQDEKVDEWVRRAAAEALGKLGRADDAVRSLLALAQDEKVDEWGRRDAVEALGKLGRADDTVIQGLLALAQDEKVDRWVRRAAAEALGALGRADDTVIQGLLALAQDEKVNADMRHAAAEALGKLGRADDAVRILLALAQDEKVEAWVRRAAAEALGKLGHADDAVRILLALAQDKKVRWQVRLDAVEALGKLGKKLPQVALALLKLANDKDYRVRNAAYRALKEVVGGGQRTVMD